MIPLGTGALRQSVKAALWACGHYARRLARDRFPGVAVLCYHGVRGDRVPARAMPFEGLHVRARELEAHCRLLRDHCDPISLDRWRAALAGRAELGDRPVLMTFDDGYRSLATIARPILERYRIPAVAFVCTDPAERQRLHWYDALARLRGEAAVERVKSAASLDSDHVAPLAADPGDPSAPLDVEEIRELARAGGIEVGAHTATHPILARADVRRQHDEIRTSREKLERWTGRAVRAFAYPNGRPGLDYTPDTVRLVAECGFDAAFTTRSGFSRPGEPPLERSRFLVLAGTSAAELAHRLVYAWRRP